MDNRINQYVSFIEAAERLKSVLRTAWTESGRNESTAEHSWRLALLSAVMVDDFEGIDKLKVMKMCLIHDLGEIETGDISAALYPDKDEKYGHELNAVTKLFSLLPENAAGEMTALWHEYNDCQTQEAKLVKALDKAETIIQHNQGYNPGIINFEFNLGYGKEYFDYDDKLRYLREIIDMKTAMHASKQKG